MVTEAQQAADRAAWTHGGDVLTIACPACEQPVGQDCIDDFGYGRQARSTPHLARETRLLRYRLTHLYDLIIAGRVDEAAAQPTERMAHARG